MAALSAIPTPSITFCEPHAAWITLPDEPCFYKPHVLPVTKAVYDGDHEAHTSGLSFQDAERISVVQRHVIGHVRKTETPLYAMSDILLRKLLVFSWERRAHISDGHGSDRKRLRVAHRKLLARIPELTERLDRLCVEFVVSTDPARRKILTSQIRSLDGFITHVRRGPALTAAIVFYYFRAQMDSVAVAEALRTTSTYIRQQLHRLKRDAERMAQFVQNVNAMQRARARRSPQREAAINAKISVTVKERWADPEQRAKQTAAMVGKHFIGWTPEERRSAMARDTRGEKNPQFGKPGTRRGHKWSAAQRAKHAATVARNRAERKPGTRLGSKWSDELRAKIAAIWAERRAEGKAGWTAARRASYAETVARKQKQKAQLGAGPVVEKV